MNETASKQFDPMQSLKSKLENQALLVDTIQRDLGRGDMRSAMTRIKMAENRCDEIAKLVRTIREQIEVIG